MISRREVLKSLGTAVLGLSFGAFFLPKEKRYAPEAGQGLVVKEPTGHANLSFSEPVIVDTSGYRQAICTWDEQLADGTWVTRQKIYPISGTQHGIFMGEEGTRITAAACVAPECTVAVQ